MMTDFETIDLESLYQTLLDKGEKELFDGKQHLIYCSGLKVRTQDGFKMVNYISKHKTKKRMLKFSLVSLSHSIHREVTMTEDHSCMLYRDGFFEDIKASHARMGDYVKMYDKNTDKNVMGYISSIVDIGNTDEFVYDIELGDIDHTFFANDVLVHNSQFINLSCITDFIRNKYGLPPNIHQWEQKYREELWNTMNDIVETNINKFVRTMVNKVCHTNNQNVLTYELEYMADIGIYESKKHYAVHKIFDEGDPVDKIKYSGIELKKASVPKEIKKFIKDIYEGTLLHDWNEASYTNYISEVYDKFKTLTIDDISFWKGYSTERSASGFLQMEKGTTGIAKACTYYNQIIKSMKLDKKYDEIRVGDKVRMCYIIPTNKFGIDCIAYKNGQWPKEFKKIFEPDYSTMFLKVVLDPLKRFREACGYKDYNPSQAPLFDISKL